MLKRFKPKTAIGILKITNIIKKAVFRIIQGAPPLDRLATKCANSFLAARISQEPTLPTPELGRARRCANDLAITLFADKKVLAGPFTGLVYPNLESNGSALHAKLFGTYEAELFSIIEQIIAYQPSLIIDVGCAEGYYANGFALQLPDAAISAVDIDSEARKNCESMSKVNQVQDRVSIIDSITEADLLKLPTDQHVAILSDCEGFEKALITPRVINHLPRAWFLIELHEFLSPCIEMHFSTILREMDITNASFIESIDDFRRLDALKVMTQRGISRQEAYWLCREGRPHTMKWLSIPPRLVS